MALLAKCGLIVLDSLALYASATPPVRAAPKDQQIVPGFIESVQTNMQTLGGPVFIKLSYCMVSLAEVLVILAREFPDHPYSTPILTALTFPGASSLSRISITPWFLVGSALVTLGGLLRVWCFRTLGQHFTFEMSLLKDHKLVTSGPYNLIRHPSYTGGAALLFGALLSRGTAGSWLRESGFAYTSAGKVICGVWALIALLSLPGFVARVRAEDAFLRKEFGQQWVEWSRRVPYTLFPYIY